jgi:hypothetical protein
VAGGLEQVRQGRSWAASARKLLELYRTLGPSSEFRIPS